MRRREFITFVGGAAAWPLATQAQPAVLPVVAYVSPSLSAASPGQTIVVLRQALAEAGYVDGRNVVIEFHTAEGQYDRLPTMVAELVRRQSQVLLRRHSRQKLRLKRFQSCSVPLTIPLSLVLLLASRDRAGMRQASTFTSLNLA
jgi:putative tryptophan/tyrosine transport system substrate-binding protein